LKIETDIGTELAGREL